MYIYLILRKNNAKKIVFRKRVWLVRKQPGCFGPKTPLKNTILTNLELPHGGLLYANIDLGDFGLKRVKISDVPALEKTDKLEIRWPENIVEF